MTTTTLILIVLILLALAALPAWPYARGWGYGPTGLLTIAAIVLLVMFLFDWV